MSSIPMPFFATRGATLYTERVRAEKDTFKREFGVDSIPVEDAHRYSPRMMNYIWSQYNRYAPFQFQKNIENSKTTGLKILGTPIEALNSLKTATKHL